MSIDWLEHFQKNRADRRPIPWERGIHPEYDLRLPLIRSLQKFQVGESGEGRHLIAGAARTGDQVYTEAIRLFVQEEQEHAALLGRLIRGMGGSLLESHWSDAVFIFIRRLMGLHLELMVLLVAEMIAKKYYRSLLEGTADPVLRAVFAQICHDEEGHITFHIDTLQDAFGRRPLAARLFIMGAWQVLFWGVCLVVALDHMPVLRAVGVSAGEFLRDCNRIFADVSWRVFRPPATLEERLQVDAPGQKKNAARG